MSLLPVYPEHGLYVSAVEDEVAQSFIEAFHVTWNQVPQSARQMILFHWQNPPVFAITSPEDAAVAELGQQLLNSLPRRPDIRLLDGWEGRPPSRSAQCGIAGMQLLFHRGIASVVPQHQTSVTIAHELAHVYHYAQEAHGIVEFGRDRELHARSVVTEWGYDWYEHAQWIADNIHLIEQFKKS